MLLLMLCKKYMKDQTSKSTIYFVYRKRAYMRDIYKKRTQKGYNTISALRIYRYRPITYIVNGYCLF